MSILKKITTWPFRPFISETSATGLIGAAFTTYFVLLLMKWLADDLDGYIVLVGVSFILLALPYASIALLARSKSRSYRDNTGSRAMCELIGVFGLVCFALIVRPML